MRVHTESGNGFEEVIYQRALAIEFRRIGLSFDREFNMKVYYSGEEDGERRVDFFVEGKISAELKVVSKPDNSNLSHAKNYLGAYDPEAGLLLNFGVISLDPKESEMLNLKPIPFPPNPKNPPKSWFRQHATI